MSPPSRGGDVAVYVFDINQLSLPTSFHSVLVSISVFMAIFTVLQSINSPDSSPLYHSALSVLLWLRQGRMSVTCLGLHTRPHTFLFYFTFCNCIVHMGFLPWETWFAFPGESQLRQSRAIQTTVHVQVFQWFHNSPNSDMDYRIFNVRTGVNACDCTRWCTNTVRESALKVDFGRKVPCRTEESNLRQQRASPTLYQLSYIPKHTRPYINRKKKKKKLWVLLIPFPSIGFVTLPRLLPSLVTDLNKTDPVVPPRCHEKEKNKQKTGHENSVVRLKKSEEEQQ